MKFDIKIQQYSLGDKRIKTWFALFPVIISGYIVSNKIHYSTIKVRWLKTVTVEQEYVTFRKGSYQWLNIKFIGE